MFECITGILATSPLLIMWADPARRKTVKQSAMLIVLDVETFRPLQPKFFRPVTSTSATA